MKHLDYIIVGLGIAGISFCEQLRKNNKEFVVFSDNKKGATAHSGGVLNPTILKFFTAVWKASEFYPEAQKFYDELSLNSKKYSQKIDLYRIFSNVREQNNWSVATDKNRTKAFLSSKLVTNSNPFINAPLGFGKVTGSLQIFVPELLSDYKTYLKHQDKLVSEPFHYHKISIQNNRVEYQNFSAKHIVFCEGMGGVKNPFFPKQKLIGNRGEYLIIHAPKLKSEVILKGPIYLIPLGNDLYKAGATFEADETREIFSEAGEKEIRDGIAAMISCDFEVVDKTVGIRPTTLDRHPLIGSATEFPQFGFINGLGSRGFLMAPLLSKILFNHFETGFSIPPEMNINRKMDD